MAASVALIELQTIAQAGDTAALVARRPFLMDAGQDIVQALERLTSKFLLWEAAPDGRRRVQASGDFYSAFVTASVLSQAAREHRLDLKSMTPHLLVLRVRHLIASGALEVRQYATKGEFVKALRDATLQHRGDAEMACDAVAGFVDCDQYQAAQAAEGDRPAIPADDLVQAEFMRMGKFGEAVDEFGIPDVLTD